jgi:hypothetical protein
MPQQESKPEIPLIPANFIFYRNPAEHPNIRKQISKEAPWGLNPLGYEYSNGSILKLGWGSVWFKGESQVGILISPNLKRYTGRITLFTKHDKAWVDANYGTTRFTGLTGMHYPGIAVESAEYKNKAEFLHLLSQYDYNATYRVDEMLVVAHFVLDAMKNAARD